MYPIIEMTLKDIAERFSVYPYYLLSVNAGFHDLRDGKVSYGDSYLSVSKDKNKIADFSAEAIQANYLSKVQDCLYEFKLLYGVVPYNKLKYIFNKKYKQTVQNAQKNADVIIEELSDINKQQDIFNEKYSYLTHSLDKKFKIFDFPLKLGDSIYEIYLGGSLSFDGIDDISNFIRTRKYKITEINISKKYYSDSDNVDFDIFLYIESEGENAKKEQVNFTYSEEEGGYILKKPYSNVKFFDNEKEFNETYKVLLKKISEQLIQRMEKL